MSLSLLIGITLLVAVFVCHPMFENGANDQILSTTFSNYAETYDTYPATITRTGAYEFEGDYSSAEPVYDNMAFFEQDWLDNLRVDPVAIQEYVQLSIGGKCYTSLGTSDFAATPTYMKDLDEHVVYLEGVPAQDVKPEVRDDGITYYPCTINIATMDKYGLVVGETFEYQYVEDDNEELLSCVVVGIFDVKDSTDPYWQKGFGDMKKWIYMSEDVFNEVGNRYHSETILYSTCVMLDYTGFNRENALNHLEYLKALKAAISSIETPLISILSDYKNQITTTRIILYVLELPMVVMLLLFIYMVTSQMIGSEASEIAVLRSRGVKRGQTLKLYFLQALMLCIFGIVLGFVVGYGMCKAAASTDSFLTFTLKDVSMYRVTWRMLPYAGIAAVVAIIFMTLPVIKYSKQTIVTAKSRNTYSGKMSLWEKTFIDVILLGVSIYLLYNYTKQSDALRNTVLNDGALDPVIFLDASLFIIASGLVLIRLMRYLIMLVDKIGKKKWKPAVYASFLQIRRTYGKMSFIAVFLVMTVSNGIFNANMARTIGSNTEERIRYDVGCDVQLSSEWTIHKYAYPDGGFYWYYDEPEYSLFEQLVEDGVCESITRVIQDDGVSITSGSNVASNATMLAINTKEFGETARLKDGLTEEHWFKALNALAAEPNGAIVTTNFANFAGIDVGSTVTLTRSMPDGDSNYVVKVVAIIDAFPGYDKYDYNTELDGTVSESERYLIVTNFASEVNAYTLTPYRIWMRLAPGHNEDEIRQFTRDNNLSISYFVSADEKIEDNNNSAVIQITNGMFTMSFAISIIVCFVGFLLYWIMSIKQRELLFGIYRAMGMGRAEISGMLMNEQIFGSFLPIIVGSGVGMAATFFFVKLIALVYLPENHSIPVTAAFLPGDMIRLGVIMAVMLIICFIIIRRILGKMKVAQALKLGED